MQNVHFRLPFNEAWLTFWGGDSKEQNHHHDVTPQKFAFDFIQVDDDGKFYKTNGKTNEDYFSFGKDVLSPADGVVVEVVDGMSDNPPGQLNNYNIMGNYIVIEHAKDVFSYLAHLKQFSPIVKVGDKVKSGDKIAECGNSGNTTDPHLHFHVQNSRVFTEVDSSYHRVEVAVGLKVFFEEVLATNKDGSENIKAYSPVKGDTVSSQ